jgi:HisJ family histidinol phosphate phosphatase
VYILKSGDKMSADIFAYDSHIHTVYSGHSHGSMTVQAILEEKVALGLKGIAITEHVFGPEDLSKIRQIACEIPPSDEGVVLGVEMDADASSLDGTLVAPTEGIDWVVASFHKFPGTSIWWHDKSFRQIKDEKSIYDEWLAWVHRVITRARPDALGHLGVLICQLSMVKTFDGQVLSDFAGILQSCRKYGVAIELNEGTYRKISHSQRATYHRVFHLAKREKVKIVLGSDAHSLSEIGRYAWVGDIVRKAGIKETDCVFPTRRR